VTRASFRLAAGKVRGFTLIELLVSMAIIAVLAAIAIPMLQDVQRKAKYTRAVANARIAVVQSIEFAASTGAYPRSLADLRNSGYGNVPDRDPWNGEYLVSALMANGASLDAQGDVWVCSYGPIGFGNCPPPEASGRDVPGFPTTGLNGSVGYSSVYGSWSGT
jgi:prepilin-type N-terminal cleavage/methylation domain-containing protein